jgi:hypothetical protein
MEVRWLSFGDVLAWVHDDATYRWSRERTQATPDDELNRTKIRTVRFTVQEPCWEEATIFVEILGRDRRSDSSYVYRARRDAVTGWAEEVEQLL